MATIAASPTHNALGKAARRLLPLLFVLYVINFVDRANISVAALAMNADLRLSATAYGTAAGVFFLGYVLFQVPANAALARFGAGRTLTAVVLAWGVCSAATALVTSAHTLVSGALRPRRRRGRLLPRRHRVSDGVVSVRAASPRRSHLSAGHSGRQHGRPAAVWADRRPRSHGRATRLAGNVCDRGIACTAAGAASSAPVAG